MSQSYCLRLCVVIAPWIVGLAATPLIGADVIVDNTDGGFSVLSGTWGTRTSASDRYGSNYRRATTATTPSAEVQWQPSIPTAGDYQVFVWYPSDSSRITDARYTVHYNGGSQTFSVNQQQNMGQWVRLGTGMFNFLAGSSANGRVTLTNESATGGQRVYADAVRFYKPDPVNLTMAVSPGGSGTTTPAEGGPYVYTSGDVVSITATPAAGYAFSQWQVSAGSNVANPTSASTTVTMDVTKTVTAVFVPVTLTMAVSPAGAGTTVPAVGGPYPKTLNEVVSISATANAGYRFLQWTVSAGSNVASPTSPSTTVTMDTAKTVTAVFEQIALTMAVSPPGAGTTVPAVGGPYPKGLNEVVSISATAGGGGYTFDHWTVSAGSNVANPTSPSTTVTMDVAKTVTAVFNTPTPPEFRAFWADVFHYGLQTAAQIDQMISLAVQGNYNVVIPEVLAFHDNEVGSHGAYWRSNIVARSVYVDPVGQDPFDPLAYMCQQAHANGLELHPWLVAFRVCSTWPPPGNAYLAAHPEWLKVPKAAIGTIAKVGSYYEFDPGSPDVQDYLASVVRELVTDYPIDGIHWDYIRSTNTDSGYPSDLDYYYSGLKRFQRIYNRSDVPNATGDAEWDDFRRRSITELVRRIRWEIPLITSNPRQPVRHSASVVTWYPCNTNFHLTRPYYEVFSDWEYWQSEGYLDSPVLMAYFDEDGSYDQTYRDWVDNTCNLWRYNRQVVIGPGIYMNSFANSVIQLQYARNAGADGLSTYSYATTNDTSTTWTDWYPYVAANLFTSTAPVPSMPWRYPATATEGTLYGRVTDGGVPVDDATVQVGALGAIKTDGGGYYIVTQIPASAGGTSYSVTASKTGYTPVTHSSVQVVAGDVRRDDLDFSGGCVAPSITGQPAAQNVCPGSNASFTVTATGDAPLSYHWQKNQVDLSDGGHYSGVTTTTLAVTGADAGDVAAYRCVVTNSCGSATSNEAALTLKAATAITQQPAAQNVCPGATAVFAVAATGDGTVSYQWQKNQSNLANGGHYSGATTATLTVSSADSGDVASYRCVATSGCGSATSNEAALTLKAATVITQQPTAQNVCPGATAVFTVAATGDGTVTYQWQKDGGDLSNGGHYSGVTTATLTVSNADSGDAGNYRCIVTAGCGSATSNDAALTLRAATAITQQPTPQSVCPGATAVFTVAATGDGTVTYQWQKDGGDLSDGGHYSGVTTATLTVSSADAGDVANYRCVVTAGCGSATSNEAALTLKAATAITQQPTPQIGGVCPGGTAVFTVAAVGDDTLTYQWQKNQSNLSDGGHYSGVTTPSLTISNVDAGDAGNYRCVVTGGCGSATSNEAALTLKAATVITQQPEPQSVRLGESAVFNVSAAGEGTVTYQWQKNGGDVSDGGHYSGATTATLAVSPVDGGDVAVYRCVVTAGCGSATSSEATLTLMVSKADLDQDGDVDLLDFSAFQGCFNGPNQPAQAGCTVNADLDADADVDLLDFSVFQSCFNGPNRPANGGCY